MSGMQRAVTAYDQATETIPPLQQIVLLYDCAIRRLREARAAIEAARIPARHVAVAKAVAIVDALQRSLDHDGAARSPATSTVSTPTSASGCSRSTSRTTRRSVTRWPNASASCGPPGPRSSAKGPAGRRPLRPGTRAGRSGPASWSASDAPLALARSACFLAPPGGCSGSGRFIYQARNTTRPPGHHRPGSRRRLGASGARPRTGPQA